MSATESPLHHEIPSQPCQGTMVLASAADIPKKPLSNISAPSTKPPCRAYITLPKAWNAPMAQRIKRWKSGSWWNIWNCQFIVVDANCVGDTFYNWAYSGSLIATKAANLPHLNYILKGQGHAARNEVLNQIPYVDCASGNGWEHPTVAAYYWLMKYLPNNDTPTAASMSGSKNSCRSKRV